jgi:5-methylcytosine-specific restriction endonuclease McrA
VSQQLLIIDSVGQPVRWAGPQRAARYYAAEKVVTELGEHVFSMTGGYNRERHRVSEVVYSSIIMVRGRHRMVLGHDHVGLSRERLFLRDRHICAYCGGHFAQDHLTIEHIIPLSRGGRHHWMNVVTACRGCNHRKGNRTPEEARMTLLYVPYRVCRNEGFILSNRHILADQMAFLQAHLPKHSRWARQTGH